MLTKTNAARALDRLGIAYEIRPYRADPDDLSPARLSRELELPAEAIYKTLVARDARHLALAQQAEQAADPTTEQCEQVGGDGGLG
jgi:prolyl-tRNA editing enzyme YbaK/EbsC (Cys-tRNA(Pro) deacylase)